MKKKNVFRLFFGNYVLYLPHKYRSKALVNYISNETPSFMEAN